MTNTTNNYLFSTTNTGASLGTSVDYVPNLAGPIFLSGGSVVQTFEHIFGSLNGNGFFRWGVSLNDFNDGDIGYIAIPFNAEILKNGTLLGAISQTVGTPGLAPQEWDGNQTYTAGTYVFYYDSPNQILNIYVALNAITITIGTLNPSPVDDPVNWAFFQEAFYLRLVPAENPLQSGLQGQDRFYHYVKCYPVYIFEYGTNYVIQLAAKDYQDYYGATNVQNAVYVDNSFNSTNSLGVSNSVNIIISGTVFSASFPTTTTPKFLLNSKVRIRPFNNLSGPQVTIPLTGQITGVSGTTGISGSVLNVGTWNSSTQFSYADFVVSGGIIYYCIDPNGAFGFGQNPSNAAFWTPLYGTFTAGIIDPVIEAWNIYLETDFFEQELIPIPAGSTSSSNAHAGNEINNYAYNDQIINQKQTLFTAGDYIIHDGFPFDKESITGGTINITAGLVPNSISAIVRPVYTTTNASDLPLSDNRWIPIDTDFSAFDFPANANYDWSSHNGATTRNLTVFNDAANTYLPDLLAGNTAYNPSANANLLKLATPDASIPPLTAVNSVAFKNNDLMFQSDYNPYKIDGSTANDFSTFMVLYLDYVPSAVMNSQIAADQTNWYGIMSQAKQTNVLATDIANWKNYTQIQPRLSVRYKLDGTVSLNLGDRTLTAIRTRNGINRPFQPLIIGLTINAADTSATLTVVDGEINRSTVTYAKNWGAATPEVPNMMLYGAVPYAKLLNSSKMYVLEINHYYSSHDDAFFDNEIKTMDKMYAVTSGRVS